MSFKDDDGRESRKQYNLPTLEITDYNFRIDGKKFFEQAIKNNLNTYNNIRNIATGQSDDYTAECLSRLSLFQKIKLTYNKNYFKRTTKTICWSKNKVILGNLDRAEGSTFFVIEEAKETVLGFWKGTVKVLWFYFVLI